MTMVEKPEEPLPPIDLPVTAPEERTRYLRWVAQRVHEEDFWMHVKEHILEDFANLLNHDLPEELWAAAYSQRDGRDYLIAMQTVLERLQEYCARTTRRG